MNDDCTTNSHYLTYIFSLKSLENVLFELGSERVTVSRRYWEKKVSKSTQVICICDML